jgi:hypothetical protein
VPRREGRSGAVRSGLPLGRRFPTGHSQSRRWAISEPALILRHAEFLDCLLIALCSSGAS